MKANNESDQNQNDRIDRIEIMALIFAIVGTTGVFTVIGTVLLQKYFSFWVAFAISLPIAFVICCIVHKGQGSIDAAAQTGILVIWLLVLSLLFYNVQRRRPNLFKQQKSTSPSVQIQKMKQDTRQPRSTPAAKSD